MKKSSQNAFLAAAVSGILAAAAAPSEAVAAEDKSGGNVPCYGINACSGKSACMTKANACAGQNACKGKGFMNVKSKEECLKQNGSLAEKTNDKGKKEGKKPKK